MSLGTACAQQNILATAQKVNNYFMKKYADPTVPFIEKETDSLDGLRRKYYEGLIFYTIDKQKDILNIQIWEAFISGLT